MAEPTKRPPKNRNAQALNRLRHQALSPARRTEIARLAALARWSRPRPARGRRT